MSRPYVDGATAGEPVGEVVQDALGVFRVPLNAQYVIPEGEHLHGRLLRESDHLGASW